MSQSPNKTRQDQSAGNLSWFVRHFPVLLLGWFWFGMFLCGFLAPPHRVAELQSSLVSEGWHLSVMACVLGGPVLIAYWLRMTGRWEHKDLSKTEHGHDL